MSEFIAGALAMAYWVVGVFFVRAWTKTHDRLFATFAAAFFVLGSIRIALVMAAGMEEHQWYLYWLRLLAYLLILFAVIDKNRR
jgi:hypothetical protein